MARYAVCTLAYNEGQHIKACIENWKGVVEKHLVLVSTKPWNGSPVEDDGTYRKAVEAGAEVIIGEWPSEGYQRTWGLARLYDYDYVLIVDADEFYTKEAQDRILHELDIPIRMDWKPNKYVPAFRLQEMLTYWKTPDYRFEPKDNHKPFIAVDPKQTYSHEHRQFKMLNGDYIQYSPVIEVKCHHMSWAKSDAKIKEKIQSFSHSDSIRGGWYENVWSKWEPGSGIKVRAYGEEPSIAIYDPAPEEIKQLLLKNA